MLARVLVTIRCILHVAFLFGDEQYSNGAALLYLNVRIKHEIYVKRCSRNSKAMCLNFIYFSEDAMYMQMYVLTSGIAMGMFEGCLGACYNM